jgi:glycosyltransferase involved in cell wall biosynthesis
VVTPQPPFLPPESATPAAPGATPRLRVVYLITDLDLGGTPLVLADRVRDLHRTGRFDITVVSIKPLGPVATRILDDGIRVLSLNARSTAAFPILLIRWIKLLRRIRPNVVNSLLVHANLLAVLGKPFAPRAGYIQELHTVQERPRWHWKISRRIARSADAVTAPSQAVLDKLAPFGSPCSTAVIPNGVDVPRFANADPLPPEAFPWPPDDRVVGYLGRFDPVKNLPLLIDAFTTARSAQVPADPPIHLALIGYGPQEAELRNQVIRLHLDGFVHLFPPSTTPERWIKSLDAIVLPSLAEGFGMIVAEALAAGKRVLAFDCAALRSVVGPSYPLISPPTADALALAIASLKKGSEAPSNADRALQARIALHFSLAATSAKHADLLEKSSLR